MSRGYKTFIMLNSAELEIHPSHNVQMPTINTAPGSFKARKIIFFLSFLIL